jgi:hypothetical protein
MKYEEVHKDDFPLIFVSYTEAVIFYIVVAIFVSLFCYVVYRIVKGLITLVLKLTR